MMNRPLEWISFIAALAALGLDLAQPFGNAHTLVLVAGSISAFAAIVELVFEPKRILLLLGFLPALPCAFSLMILHDSAVGHSAFVAFVVALQARLFFLRAGDRARARNRSFAEDLKSSLPEKAMIFVDTDIEGEAPLSAIHRDHLVRIKPGDRIPADGQITFGSSFIDESPLTGERDPVTKSMGSYVFAGTLNKNGTFLFKVGDQPSRSLAMRLSAALERGFPFESIFSQPFFILEGLTFAGTLAFILLGASTTSVLNLFLLSSGAFFAAALWVRESSFVARSSAQGFEWKNREAVFSVASAGSLVSSATGVLTEGRIKLASVMGTEELSEDGALRLVGPLARRLEDEFSFALLREMLSRNIRLELVDGFHSGADGVRGNVDGEEVRWMNLETARLEGFPLAKLASFAEERLAAGESVQVLARAGRAAAAFSFRDPISADAPSGIKALKNLGLPFVMVARDSQIAILHLQQELYLQHVHPECEEKDVSILLDKLGRDGLEPIWVANPPWHPENPLGITLVPGIPGIDVGGEVFSLRRDITSIAKLVRMAKSFAKGKRTYFLWALCFQLALLPFALRMDPRLAAAAGAVCGVFMLFSARNGGRDSR